MPDAKSNSPAPSGQLYLADALQAYGVTHVFMVPTALLKTMAALDRKGVQVIMTHGEKSAAYMADAYARATRKPGICYAQNIGASNLAAGLRDAYMAGSPVIALTGGTNAKNSYRNYYQQVDDFSAFDGVTKFNAVVEDVQRLPDLLRQAFRIATTGQPGPVHLRIPGALADGINVPFATGPAHGPLAEPRFRQYPAFRPAPEPQAVRAALEVLARAKRPVMVIGGGVVASGAQAEAVELARRLSIPIVTSMNAKGTIDERDPLCAGVVGGYSRDSANRTVMEADLVFFVGSATGSQVTDGWRLPAMGSPVIQLDIDPEELGHHYPNQVSILADAKIGLRQMIDAAGPAMRRDEWCATVAGFVREWREETKSDRTDDVKPIKPQRLAEAVTRALPDNGILLSDTGHAGIWTAGMVDMRPGQSFLRCAGSLGWAFPAAIGAAMAAPDRPVVCFTGDGGFFYHIGELETAARYNSNVTIVVNNNGGFSQNTRSFQFAFDDKITPTGDMMWRFNPTDLVKTAEAMGCRARRIENPAELEGAIKDAIAIKGPVILDVQGDVDTIAPPTYGGTDFYGNTRASTKR